MKLVCTLFGHSFQQNVDNHSRYDRLICKNCKTTAEYETEKWKNTFWESDTFDSIKVAAGVILFFGGALLVILTIVGAIASAQSYFTCNQYKDIGIDVIWKLWTGCMANHPEFGYIPVDEYFRTLNVNIP